MSEITELKTIISSIFPNEYQKENFLKHYANVFLGGKNKGFDVWYGKGNNGKTLLFNLFRRTFFEDIADLTYNILIEKMKVEDLRRIFDFDAKVVYISENDGTKINKECLTQLLDECNTLFIITNTLDILPDFEPKNIFNFESIFSFDPDDGELLDDRNLNLKLRDSKYSEALLKILFEHTHEKSKIIS